MARGLAKSDLGTSIVSATSGISSTEFNGIISRKVRKTMKKKKEGTDGIDTSDEYLKGNIDARLRDAYEYYEGDD